MKLKRIVSGGQTGVDRAALDFAIEQGIDHGGWCPRGRLAEDGPIHPRYKLRETPQRDYATRTEWNVRDSDGTLIFAQGALRSGTALTAELARRYSKPLLVVDIDDTCESEVLLEWIDKQQVHCLNVAGPRESNHPGIYKRVLYLLGGLLNN